MDGVETPHDPLIDWGSRPKKAKRTPVRYVEPEEKYCKGCDKTLPIDSFAMGEIYRKSRCKKCYSAQVLERYHAKKVSDVEVHVARIAKLAIKTRFNAVMNVLDKGIVSRSEARTILQQMEF